MLFNKGRKAIKGLRETAPRLVIEIVDGGPGYSPVSTTLPPPVTLISSFFFLSTDPALTVNLTEMFDRCAVAYFIHFLFAG
jgi:hypothetical protein